MLTELQVFCYTSCFGVATGLLTAEIDGTVFTAQTETLTFNDPPNFLIVTYTFPSVTITSLTPGQSVILVWFGV